MGPRSPKSFARGVLEVVCVVALFAGGGLAGRAGLAPPPAAPALYPAGVEEPRPAPAEPRLFLVDGYNVLGVGLLAGRPRDSWWGPERRRELLGRVEGFEEPGAEIWVVFDGPRPADEPAPGRVRPVFAPSADDWLLERIRARGERPVTLVTADRRLAQRARRRGAEVVAPAAFLARCPVLQI